MQDVKSYLERVKDPERQLKKREQIKSYKHLPNYKQNKRQQPQYILICIMLRIDNIVRIISRDNVLVIHPSKLRPHQKHKSKKKP